MRTCFLLRCGVFLLCAITLFAAESTSASAAAAARAPYMHAFDMGMTEAQVREKLEKNFSCQLVAVEGNSNVPILFPTEDNPTGSIYHGQWRKIEGLTVFAAFTTQKPDAPSIPAGMTFSFAHGTLIQTTESLPGPAVDMRDLLVNRDKGTLFTLGRGKNKVDYCWLPMGRYQVLVVMDRDMETRIFNFPQDQDKALLELLVEDEVRRGQ